jgi:hypothetical protein
MVINDLIERSLAEANDKTDDGTSERIIHQKRSKNFVKTLADKLGEYYKNRKDIFVLSKHHGGRRLEFGLNELIFDILVCETKQVRSSHHKKVLTYITKAIWQVESEFSKSSREVMYDFNKLVLGMSENKLIIGQTRSDEKAFLKQFEEPARYCKSNTYFAFVTHPSKWKQDSLEVHLWIFRGGWKEI